MAIDPFLDEAEQLHAISTRLDRLAEDHTEVTEEVMTIAGSVRNTAIILGVLVATKLSRDGGLK